MVMVLSGENPLADRNYLIGFDAMLILVLALVVYGISARSHHATLGTQRLDQSGTDHRGIAY
jgi:hypothetical protein